jgi:hypothetical protein
MTVDAAAALGIVIAIVFFSLGFALGHCNGRLTEIDERAQRERIAGKDSKGGTWWDGDWDPGSGIDHTTTAADRGAAR